MQNLRPKTKPLLETGREIPRAGTDADFEAICKEAAGSHEKIAEIAKRRGIPRAMVLDWLDSRGQCVQYERQSMEWGLIQSIKNDLESMEKNTSTIEKKIIEKLVTQASKEDSAIGTNLRDYIDLTKLQLQRLDVLMKLAEKAKLPFDFLQPQVKEDVKEKVSAAPAAQPVSILKKDDQQVAERALKILTAKMDGSKQSEQQATG